MATHRAADRRSGDGSARRAKPPKRRPPSDSPAAPHSPGSGPARRHGATRHRRRRPWAWRLTGLLLFAGGLAAALLLRDPARALLSTPTVPGLLLLLAPPPWNGRRANAIGLLLGLLGVVGLPSTLLTVNPDPPSCPSQARQPLPTKPQQYNVRDRSAHFYAGPDSTSGVTFPELRWAGYAAALPDDACAYRIDLDAREIRPTTTRPQGAGWGYGIGTCSTADPQGPTGLSLQYAFFQQSTKNTIDSLEIVHLPDANSFPNNVAQGQPTTLDYQWHHWTISVQNGQAEFRLDDDYVIAKEPLSGQDGLPPNCRASGFLFRAWGGSAELKNLSVIRL